MTDLAELFSTHRADTRRGEASVPTATIDSSGLQSLLPERAVQIPGGGAGFASGLAELVGERPHSALTVSEGIVDVDALRAIVGPSVPVSTAIVPGPAARPTRRSRAGRDRVALTAVAMAVAAAVVAALVVGTVLLTKPPTADALRVLDSSEAVLVDRTEALNARVATVSTGRAARVARAAELQVSLSALAGLVDEPARAAAESARQAYAVAIERLDVPAPLPRYHRGAIDETSPEAIAAAVDETQVRAIELDRFEEKVARAEEALRTLGIDLRAKLAALVTSVPGTAAAIAAQNPDADPAFRDAVARAAEAVASTDPVTKAGLDTWTAYIVAVVALRTDQQRALDVLAAQQAEEETSVEVDEPVVVPETPSQPGTPTPTPEPTPAPTPTEPGGPTDSPELPAPLPPSD